MRKFPKKTFFPETPIYYQEFTQIIVSSNSLSNQHLLPKQAGVFGNLTQVFYETIFMLNISKI